MAELSLAPVVTVPNDPNPGLTTSTSARITLNPPREAHGTEVEYQAKLGLCEMSLQRNITVRVQYIVDEPFVQVLVYSKAYFINNTTLPIIVAEATAVTGS